MRTFRDPDEVLTAKGEELGPGEWMTVDQERIDRFAEATGDHQWIHVDPERAAAGPYGATIAHGYLTLSLLPVLMAGLYTVQERRLGLNYGLDRVRFPAPLPVGSRVRARSTITEAIEVTGGVQATFSTTLEVEGGERPACVAATIVRFLR